MQGDIVGVAHREVWSLRFFSKTFRSLVSQHDAGRVVVGKSDKGM